MWQSAGASRRIPGRSVVPGVGRSSCIRYSYRIPRGIVYMHIDPYTLRIYRIRFEPSLKPCVGSDTLAIFFSCRGLKRQSNQNLANRELTCAIESRSPEWIFPVPPDLSDGAPLQTGFHTSISHRAKLSL